MRVEINDTIRAYDFKPCLGRADVYVEGVVLERNAIEECGYNAYKIEVTTDMYGEEGSLPKGKGSRVGEIVYVPWKVAFMEYDGRVMNLTRI